MSDGLSDLRVIELGGGVSAPMAGKMLADLGATVVKVEPPGGDPERRRGPFRDAGPHPEGGGTFLYLNANKRSVVLNLREPSGRARLETFVERAELLIHNLTPREMEACGVAFERFAERNPRLVMLSITPFGLTGPWRDFAGNDLTLTHGGGWGWLCPGSGTPPELPPIKPFGRHALAQAGLHGAAAALAACYGAAQSGVGEHIDLSVQETVAFLLGQNFGGYTYTGKTISRTDLPRYEPNSFYPCQDGHVFIICPEQSQWDRLVALMGNPDWACGDRFENREKRGAHAVELKAGLSAWTSQWSMEALFHACQGARIGVAPVLRHEQLETQQQLQERGFFATQHHPVAGDIRVPGAPYRLRQPWWNLRRPAPALGEAEPDPERLLGATAVALTGHGSDAAPHAPGPLPLAGVRVLDFSWVWAGPHCTLMLALLGAEVIKVESSARPDITRRSALYPPEMGPGLNRSGYFNQINQGKQSVCIDLSRPEGVDLVKRLAAQSDVMVSNFGTGVLEKLGLGPEEMGRINPDLTIAMISGFGQTGPWRQYTGYGPLFLPLAGVALQTGYEDGVPQDAGLAYGDPNGAAYTAIAIAAALWARRREGAGGQRIDLSLWEAMLCTSFEGWMNHALDNPPGRPAGNRDPVDAPHNVYRCRGEDRWVAIAARDERQWRGLCDAMGCPELADDPRFRAGLARKSHEDALDEVIGAWCADRERWAVTHALQAAGVPAMPSLDTRDLVESPHLNARGAFTRWAHPEVGVRTHMGSPWRLTRRADPIGRAAPLLGQHTDSVLERLGLNPAERKRLREEKIVA